MGIKYNPRAVTNGLVGYWDAGNTLRSAKGYKNLLDLTTWTLGTGGTTGFVANGTVAENQRILDTGPLGTSTVVWDEPSNDATSNDDGGWNTTSIPIDPTKMYRFSTWMRRKVIGDGAYYLGIYALNAADANDGVLVRANGNLNTNHYFSATNWPTANVPANSWMLVVGHVWPAGSGTGSDHPDSGLWDTTGTKFSNYTSSGDAVWQATNAKTWHRSYLYYSTITTTNQQWYQPRIDVMDGTQPTIADLMAGMGAKWYDPVGGNHGTVYNSAQLYKPGGYMTFDGVDDYVLCPYQSYMTKSGNYTFSTWIRTSSATNGVIFQNCNNDATDRNGMTTNGNNSVVFGYYNGTAWVQVYAPINSGQWNHVVGVNSGGTLTLYSNGVPYTTVAGSLYVHIASGLYFGRQTLDDTLRFNGDMSNVMTYNRALTAQEVKQNFNAMRGRYGI